MHFISLPRPEHLSAHGFPWSSDSSCSHLHTPSASNLHQTLVTLALARSCRGYFQELAAPRELGFSLRPHSFLASSLPLGCPDEVAEHSFKGESVRQYHQLPSPSLPWWSPDAHSPSYP